MIVTIRRNPLNELSLFSGAGGGLLAGKLLGWTTVGAVEIEPAPREILLKRQVEGHLPSFPVWDDVTTFDGLPWRGLVDIITGGFPCQDISIAGTGDGIDGERSGLWSEMARIIREVEPGEVLVENSPALTLRGLGRVLGDLAEVGYDAEWCVLSAAEVGAPHKRERIWILAHSRHGTRGSLREACQGRDHTAQRREDRGQACGPGQGLGGWWDTDPADLPHSHSVGQSQPQGGKPNEWGRPSDIDKAYLPNPADLPDSHSTGHQGSTQRQLPGIPCQEESIQRSALDRGDPETERRDRRPALPGVGGMADGLASGLDVLRAFGSDPIGRVGEGYRGRAARIKALGNGQVPLCAAVAYKILRPSHLP